MKPYFLPDFNVRVASLRPDEVRLLGNNNHRKVLLTYLVGTGLGLVGMAFWVLIGANDYLAELGVLLFAAYVCFLLVGWWAFFVYSHPKDYIKDEIQFSAEGIWVKVGIVGESSGFLRPNFPLDIYVQGQHHWFVPSRAAQPIFEFVLPQDQTPDSFLQSVAEAMQLELETVVSDYGRAKFRLVQEENTPRTGFTLSPHTQKAIYLTPNKVFSRLELEDGLIEYMIRPEYRTTSRKFHFFPDGRLKIFTRSLGINRTQTIQLALKNNRVHRRDGVQEIGDERRPVLRCDLVDNRQSILLFMLPVESYRTKSRAQLDILEDVDAFARDVEQLLNTYKNQTN